MLLYKKLLLMTFGRTLVLIDEHVITVGQDSTVSPGFESQWGRDFLHTSTLILGPTQPPEKWVWYLLPGGKMAGEWR